MMVLKRLRTIQQGITGLETAIILIAFVVVSSVFAYTVLSAGLFSSEKAKEAVYSGLEGTRSSMVIEGGVYATGVKADTLDSADAVWTGATNVTATTDSTDRKEGSASADLIIDTAFSTGVIAFKNLGSTIDISTHLSARLWIKSDAILAANVLRLLIDDTAGCGSPLESLNIPALTANTWTQVQLKLSDPSALTAVACVGITAASDPGAITLNVDLVEAPGEVSQVHFTLVNVLDGKAIDLTPTTDTDSDGIISDEATQNHRLTISYLDSSQHVGDLTWTKVQVGRGNGDDLLDSGEKMTVTVDLKALDPVPVGRSVITLDVWPSIGSTLVIERRMPTVIDAWIDLF